MSYRKQGSDVVDHPLVVRYLEFVEARARRNTVLAVASDLGIFLSLVEKRAGRS